MAATRRKTTATRSAPARKKATKKVATKKVAAPEPVEPDEVEQLEEPVTEAVSDGESNSIVLVGPQRYVCAHLNNGAPILREESLDVDDDEERARLLDMVFLNKFNQDVPYFIPADQFPAWQKAQTPRSRRGGDMSLTNLRGRAR